MQACRFARLIGYDGGAISLQSQRGSAMKPSEVFCAVVKAIGVMFWVYAVEGLLPALRYSPYFYKVNTTIEGMAESVASYWQLEIARSAIYLMLGCLLV